MYRAADSQGVSTQRLRLSSSGGRSERVLLHSSQAVVRFSGSHAHVKNPFEGLVVGPPVLAGRSILLGVGSLRPAQPCTGRPNSATGTVDKVNGGSSGFGMSAVEVMQGALRNVVGRSYVLP
jgi:hypothetical protein